MSTLKSEMALGQVHDIHYWLGYNDGQGNNSLWCLCMDDFNPEQSISHTRYWVNKQHSSSTVVEFNLSDVTLIWLELGKQYWIRPDGHISVGMCLYVWN